MKKGGLPVKKERERERNIYDLRSLVEIQHRGFHYSVV